jgi:hypothetical protein
VLIHKLPCLSFELNLEAGGYEKKNFI